MASSAHAQITGLDPDNDSFWTGVASGVLPLRRCRKCHRHFALPLPACPHCAAEDPEVVPANGTGEIHTWVVIRYSFDDAFVARVPYVVATVRLDEGARIYGRLIDVDVDAVHAGQRIRVEFPEREDDDPYVFVLDRDGVAP